MAHLKAKLIWSPATKPKTAEMSAVTHQSGVTQRVEGVIRWLHTVLGDEGKDDLLVALRDAETKLFPENWIKAGPPKIRYFVWPVPPQPITFAFVWGLVSNKEQRGKKFRGKSLFCLCLMDELDDVLERIYNVQKAVNPSDSDSERGM